VIVSLAGKCGGMRVVQPMGGRALTMRENLRLLILLGGVILGNGR
jgi:hypothetical protein